MQRGKRALHALVLVLQLRFLLGEDGVEFVDLVLVLADLGIEGVGLQRDRAVDRIGQGVHRVGDDVSKSDGGVGEEVLNGGGFVGEGGLEVSP